MDSAEAIALVGDLVNERRIQNGLERIVVKPEAPLLEGTLGIDSLDLAAIVVELEAVTGRDPFAEGIVVFQTVGALADLYADRHG